MRKYGKWVLTMGLLAATPGLTLAAGSKSTTDDKPAAGGNQAAKTENQAVAETIAKALRAKRAHWGDISIEYKNGVATLAGTVSDARLKESATAIVSKVKGVSRVNNQLTVADASRASSARTSSARAAVEQLGNGVVPANHMAAGSKPSRVQQVNSEVPSGAVSENQAVAEQIGAAITAAGINGYDIGIRYQNGVALLQGSVGTQAERAAAASAAATIPGVQSVANRLSCTAEPAMAQQPQRGPYGPQAQPYGPQGPQGPYASVGYRQQQGEAPMPGPGGQGMPPMGAMPMGPGVPMPPSYGHPGAGASQAAYNNPSLPDYAWPTYAQYPNSAAVSYPQQYSASAWPYIGPFYPYPQVPLGWRDATLRWDDGQWNLMFRTRTDKWWWYFNPSNW
jgi:osmotically-inducible protein OsmY